MSRVNTKESYKTGRIFEEQFVWWETESFTAYQTTDKRRPRRNHR